MSALKKQNIYLPMILIILDGWGIAKPNLGNAVTLAKTANLDYFASHYPTTQICADGRCVGLPSGQDGNSEAGHMNIGAGRIVIQDTVKIDNSISKGSFYKNPVFIEAIRHIKKNKSKLHLMGMLSNGMSAHSNPNHIFALLKLVRRLNVNNAYLHLFTDGRDSAKYSSLKLIQDIERNLKSQEAIVTIMGRFYAMDRKKKWERTHKAYQALVLGRGMIAESASAAITESYNRGENDEFIEPYIIRKKSQTDTRIRDNDSVIFFNLRSDRSRQLAKVFVQHNFYKANSGAFKRDKILKNLCFVALTDFGPDLDNILTAFPSLDLKNTLPMILFDLRQLYITETEKYAHVTYFFNGGYAGKVNGEDSLMVSSPDVKSYDLRPTMEANKLAKIVINNLKYKRPSEVRLLRLRQGPLIGKYDFTVLNLAAPDMIGHTGNLKAAIKCCAGIEQVVGKITREYLKNDGTIIITADHGNIEEMINLKTGEIDTEHSANPVPFVIINKNLKTRIKLRSDGILGDIAPTILDLLKRKKPKEMTGESLIK